MNSRPIGVFDSGVGGLSILLELQKILPNESYIYIADQAYAPYGGKTPEELIDRVSKILDFFVSRGVKAVVMACNTATVYTIDEMRRRYPLPIIGTVPVVKTLATVSKTRTGAVFCTPATARSAYLADLIAKFAPHMNVLTVGGTGLEESVEEGILDTPEINEILKRELPPLVAQGVDAIALGCTHYPFLRKQIETIVGPHVSILDSGGAVARRTKEVLTHNGALANKKVNDTYYTTGDAEYFQRVAELLLHVQLAMSEHIEL